MKGRCDCPDIELSEETASEALISDRQNRPQGATGQSSRKAIRQAQAHCMRSRRARTGKRVTWNHFRIAAESPWFPSTPTANGTMQEVDILVKDPDILGGTPVFRGTRVPFQALLDYLEGGQTLDEFLDDFPTVTREASIAALELAKSLLVSHLG